MSNLRHWHARTTSATSSSTSATRRVAAAEELLRDFSKLDPLGLCPLSRCILLLPGRSLSFTCVTPRLLARPCLEPTETDPPASVASAGQASTTAGCGGGKQACQAHCPADPCFAQMCREHFGSAPSRPALALWRPCRACTSCPADRCLLAATCCTPSWPPLLLPALSCARRTMVLVGCSGCSCLHSGSCAFYML